MITITPELIVLLQLQECAAHIEGATPKPVRILQAAKSLHAALVAALTAALAGSSGAGAYRKKDRDTWLAFLQSDRTPITEVDLPQRVLTIEELLDRACEAGGIEWRSDPLNCSPEERRLIRQLSFVRGEFEHPKRMLNGFEPGWVLETFPTAVRLVVEACKVVHHHFEDQELEEIRSLAEFIAASTESWPTSRYGGRNFSPI